MTSALAPALIIIVSVPLVLKLVPRNGVYGFRTRHTVESDEVWYPANRAAGIAMIVAAVVWLAAIMLVPEVIGTPYLVSVVTVVIGLGAIGVAVLVSLLYLRRLLTSVEEST
ncbi:uncharacterized protein METZ01_LOCUS449639 [marine metagenome]|uniref:SdpI/YhfL protein family n=1 Tax=marine metagenome TaxID=408172 RepID=A0A382ZNX9_9ZZZZ